MARVRVQELLVGERGNRARVAAALVRIGGVGIERGVDGVDPIEFLNNWQLRAANRSNVSLARKFTTTCGEAFDWYIDCLTDEERDALEIQFYPTDEAYTTFKNGLGTYIGTASTMPVQEKILANLLQVGLDAGAQIYWGCPARQFLTADDGRVTGAVGQKEDGSYVQVNAAKGVILSTGDYSQNTKMLQHFCPEVIENNIQCLFTNVDVEGSFTNQGDGIQLGMWAGAQVQQSHAPMIHHMGGGADLSGVGVMGNAGFLNLDLNGKRFMNEDLPGQQLENQIELQKNRESWQIFDSSWPEQLPYMPAAHGGACYYEDYASEDEGPKNNTTYRNYKSPYQLEAAVADGRAVKADTLEELVAKIYPDDTAAQQTALDSIQRYNELAKAGYDEDFHKPASRMWAVENGPFYADKFTTALLLVCIGGLESDEDCHTFDADRNVIPGLYVAGNIQGNRFATEYPIGLKGVSHSMAMYYGYVAGKNAMQEV